MAIEGNVEVIIDVTRLMLEIPKGVSKSESRDTNAPADEANSNNL